MDIRYNSRMNKTLSGFVCAAKNSLTQSRVNILRGRADHRNLAVVDENRSIRGDCRDESALQQINDDRRETGLNYVTADSPDYRFLKVAGATNAQRQISQVLHCENIWERGEIVLQR